ncbi:MAG: hypothetical protein ABJL67_20755, partial [Sulfitobacter sp.]
ETDDTDPVQSILQDAPAHSARRLTCAARWSSQNNQAMVFHEYPLSIEQTILWMEDKPDKPSIDYNAIDWTNTKYCLVLLKKLATAVTVFQGDTLLRTA